MCSCLYADFLFELGDTLYYPAGAAHLSENCLFGHICILGMGVAKPLVHSLFKNVTILAVTEIVSFSIQFIVLEQMVELTVYLHEVFEFAYFSQ